MEIRGEASALVRAGGGAPAPVEKVDEMLTIALTFLLAAAAPLVDAVKSGDKAAALALIQQRVDVNAPEADGTTALHWAVHQNDLDLVVRLIRAGAKVNAKNDYGATPMSEAAVTGNADDHRAAAQGRRATSSRPTPTARRR